MIRTVSWSEIDKARQCPFAHDLAYKQRWQMGDDRRPLVVGKLWHEVLEAHYNLLQEWQHNPNQLDARTVFDVVRPLLYDEAGGQTEAQELVTWVYAGYVDAHGLDEGWEILAVEHAAEVWLPTDTGARSGFRLKVKIDLVVRWQGKIWLIDHKSGRNLPKQQELALSDQFGLYAWALRKMGKSVFGIIYNAARTQRNVGPMALGDRFSRELMYRTDEELQVLAIEAWRTVKNVYQWGPGQAPRSPNPDTCFPAGTLVSTTDAELGFKNWYEGEMIEIDWGSGRLTGTPNHPILTRRGWVVLDRLVPGDEVFEGAPSERLSSNPDIQHRPFLLDQEVDSWAKQQGVFGPSSVIVDLDGQWGQGDVDIVDSFGLLEDNRVSRFQKPPGQNDLFPGQFGGQILSPQSRSDWIRPSEVGQGVKRIELSLFGSHLNCRQTPHLGKGACLNPGFTKAGADCGPADIELFRQGQLRLPGQVQSRYVVSVNRSTFRGHVYNLQTSRGWYIANHIIVHNCNWKCSFTDACLASRKGADIVQFLSAQGGVRDATRH